MSTNFDPRYPREIDDLGALRPTENSSWLVVIVLVIGVALAGWYALGRAGTSSLMQSAATPLPSEVAPAPEATGVKTPQ
jgi:hypothetical protein